MHARRKFLLLSALGAVQALPFFAFAQQRGKVWRVGFLGVSTRATAGRFYDEFVRAMRELGYVEGRNLAIEWRIADGNLERLPPLAAELVKLKVDLIVASTTPAISAAKDATSTIPIVMGVSGDPLGAGFMKSLARPGGNITGSAVAAADYSPKHLELLQRLIPKITRIGVLLNPGNASHPTILNSLGATAQKMGIILVPVEARGSGGVGPAWEKHAQRVEAFVVLADSLFMQQRIELAHLAAKHRMPAIYQLREHVEVGGLMSYGQDVSHNYRLAARYVDKIFRGASPGDLPVEQISKLELVINGKTAKALGLSIPRDVLLLADKVIE